MKLYIIQNNIDAEKLIHEYMYISKEFLAKSRGEIIIFFKVRCTVVLANSLRAFPSQVIQFRFPNFTIKRNSAIRI